jgi:polysaccharide biosynthesis transport protein
VRLESRLDQTDIAVLNPAIPPLLPVFPKIPLNVVLSVIIGTMLGCGLALLLEMMNRRVRVRDDLAYAAGIPVLAEIPRMGSRRLNRAAADMPAAKKAAANLKSATSSSPAKAA